MEMQQNIEQNMYVFICEENSKYILTFKELLG